MSSAKPQPQDFGVLGAMRYTCVISMFLCPFAGALHGVSIKLPHIEAPLAQSCLVLNRPRLPRFEAHLSRNQFTDSKQAMLQWDIN